MYREILQEELKVQKDTGYMYFIDYKHPLRCGNSGKVYYHRHMLSLKLKRWLTGDEHTHHLNGNKQDNRPENLINMSSSDHTSLHKPKILSDKTCILCGKLFVPDKFARKFCSQGCYNKSVTKLDSLTKEELEILIWTNNLTTLSVKYNCSANGIKKWAKRMGCLMPPPYFHSKILSYTKKLSMYIEAKNTPLT